MTNINKFLLVFASLIFIKINSFSQNTHGILYRAIPNTDTIVNALNIRDIGFVKNVEAFSEIIDGYTMPGNNLELAYKLGVAQNLSLKLGGSWIKYFGDKDSTILNPTVSLIWQASPNTKVVVGNLPQKLNLSLPDFLSHSERFITHPSPQGIAIMFDFKRLASYTWFESEQYIHKGSLHPEYLFGASVWDFALSQREKSQTNLKFSFTVGHRGGQINKIKMPVTTTANLSLNLKHTLLLCPRNNISASIGGSIAKKQTGDSLAVYKDGYALHAQINAKIQSSYFIDLMYFYGNQWFTFKGNQLYSNISDYKPNFGYKERSMIALSAIKQFNINQNAKAGFGAYALYEFNESTTIYGISFQMGLDFNIKTPFKK